MQYSKTIALGLVFTAASIFAPRYGHSKAEQPVDAAFNTNKDSITHVMNTAVVNDNTDPENTVPKGGYDEKTGKYTSGVVINDYATTYAKKMTKNFKGIALAFSAAPENVDYAVSMGKDVKGVLENAGIPFEYFISADASSGLSVSAYGGKGSSASVSLKNDGRDTVQNMEKRIYSYINIAVQNYRTYHRAVDSTASVGSP